MALDLKPLNVSGILKKMGNCLRPMGNHTVNLYIQPAHVFGTTPDPPELSLTPPPQSLSSSCAVVHLPD